MNFEYSQKSVDLQKKLTDFIDKHIVPVEDEFYAFQKDSENIWTRWPKIEVLKQKAKTIIDTFKGFENDKYVTICDGKTFAAGTRFCQQLQENAKAEGFLSILPENNHNMIESYYGAHKTNFILFNSETNDRVNKRFGFIKELLIKNNNRVFDLSFNDFSVAEIYKAIYILDWVSVYLTDERGEDNMLIPNIIDLKGFLSN